MGGTIGKREALSCLLTSSHPRMNWIERLQARKAWQYGLALVLLAWVAVGAVRIHHSDSPYNGIDFFLRRSEACHVVAGIDPHDVYTHKVEALPGAGWPNVYAPWVYVAFQPFTLVPPALGRGILLAGSLLALFLLLRQSIDWTQRLPCGQWSRLLLAGFFLSNLAIYLCLYVTTLGIFCALGLMGVLQNLERGQQGRAGLWWALMMVKPQIGILLAVPLLLKRQWRTIGVAASLCAALTLVVAFQTGKAPHVLLAEMWRVGLSYTSGAAMHLGLLGVLRPLGILPPAQTLALSMASGLLVVVFCCWRARLQDWFLLLLPPAAMSTIWSYSNAHDHVMLIMVFLLLFHVLDRHPDRKLLILGCAFVVALIIVQSMLGGLLFRMAVILNRFLITGLLLWYYAFVVGKQRVDDAVRARGVVTSQ